MSRDFNFWGLMIAAALAFTVVISALVWLYRNSKKRPGEK